MIRALLLAFLCIVTLAACCALGVLSGWSAAWLLFTLPSAILIASCLADAALVRYHLWALKRARARADEYAGRDVWNPTVQHQLNTRVDRIHGRVR